MFGDPLPAAPFSLSAHAPLSDGCHPLQPTPPSPLCPLALFLPFHRPMAGFVTRFAAVAVLFVLPGVAEGQVYYRGNYNTNLCPVGSEQVLSVSACQEASGDLGYSHYTSSFSGKPRGSEEGGGRWRQPGRGGKGGGM